MAQDYTNDQVLPKNLLEKSNGIAFTHNFLKEVELSGFRGYPNDMELAKYLPKNANALKKFTIDPYDKSFIEFRWIPEENNGIPTARELAQQLILERPPGVQILIL